MTDFMKLNIQLFARPEVWHGTLTVIFNANEGTGSMPSQTGAETAILSKNDFERDGWIFSGWNTRADGTEYNISPEIDFVNLIYEAGIVDSPGAPLNEDTTITIYAQWREDIPLMEETKFNGNNINKIYYNGTEINLAYFNGNVVYRKPFNVTYNANGGSGTVPANQIKKYDKVLILASNDLTKTNSTISRTVTFNANNGTTTKASEDSIATTTYTANGWNTNSSGTGASYADGSDYSNNAILDLYANFSSSTSTYTPITFPTTTQCTREGYVLLGWSNSSTATTATYEPGAEAEVSGTWYAVWQEGFEVFMTTDKRKSMKIWHANSNVSNINDLKTLIESLKSNYGTTLFDLYIEKKIANSDSHGGGSGD